MELVLGPLGASQAAASLQTDAVMGYDEQSFRKGLEIKQS